MRFELVRRRLHALPRELPPPPAVLMPIRVDAPELFPPPDPFRRGRPAAVLALLFPDATAEARILLTVRVPHLAAHAGEVSFPGGSADEDDADPIATAIREAGEEVGLDPDACGLQVVGSLERVFIPVSGFRIVPVVAVAERAPSLAPAPAEVARIVEAPVEAFLPDAPVELEERVIRERLVRFGVYPVAGERVWGATARMLGQLGAVLAAEPDSGAETLPRPLEPREPSIRRTGADDRRIAEFLERLAPELARTVPAASEFLMAEIDGSLVGVAAWAPWDRERPSDEPRGFEGLEVPASERAAELTLLAVSPEMRGQGIGRRLADAAAETAAIRGSRSLLAWTLAESAIAPSARAARMFFRSNGFRDLAVDRRILARSEDRLLLDRRLPATTG